MSDERPLICGFLKVRNEILREGNIYRVLRNMEQYCDAAVVCDDASTDGTDHALVSWLTAQAERTRRPENWKVIKVKPEFQNFRKELEFKQEMLDLVHQIKPYWVLWMDGDEVFDRAGTEGLREFCAQALTRVERAWRFHYTQFWRNTAWARTDSQFDEGYFIKLWRYAPDLVFDVGEGTHRPQFPRQVMEAFHMGLVGTGPFEQLHYGNFGKNLVWKCVQYYGGLGGVDRHLVFPQASYRPVKQATIPDGCERVVGGLPEPFSEQEIALIRSLCDLHRLEGWFTVVIPAFNRATELERALDSVMKQSYPYWIVLVLDDGSMDETPARMRVWQDVDPRIFYARYPVNRGGVAMNELGMTLACEMTEYWSRLGSDDWWGPNKLAFDAEALKEFDAVYGTYVVYRDGKPAESCNPPRPPEVNRQALLSSGFVASWANCAVRTHVLQAVRAKYGNFCDPRLRNMEDFLVNTRIARESKKGWIWRGPVKGELVINPSPEQIDLIIGPKGLGVSELEAVWTAVGTGASGNVLQYMRDENLTRQLITEENIRYGG